MGIFTELRKSYRNRENYKAQVIRLQLENEQLRIMLRDIQQIVSKPTRVKT